MAGELPKGATEAASKISVASTRNRLTKTYRRSGSFFEQKEKGHTVFDEPYAP